MLDIPFGFQFLSVFSWNLSVFECCNEAESCFFMLQFGISPERLQANKDLCSFFRILTTSTDKKNKVQDVFYSFTPFGLSMRLSPNDMECSVDST